MMMKMGPNDTPGVVWVIGLCLFYFYFFLILTNVL